MRSLNKIKRATLFVLFISALVNAQNQEIIPQEEKDKPEIKIGAKIGYSLGKLSSTTDNIYTQDYKSTKGIDWGLIIEFPISEQFSVQPEINFTMRGGKRSGLQPLTNNELSDQLNQFLPLIGKPLITNENPLYADFDNESDLNYLEIPVLAKYGWGSDIRFYLEAGPYLGFLLSSTQHTNGTSQFYFDSQGQDPVIIPNPVAEIPPFVQLPPQSIDAKTDTKDSLKSTNIGGIIGIGVIKKIGNRSELYLDSRASYSFNHIQKNVTYGKSNIGGVIFSVGYTYYL